MTNTFHAITVRRTAEAYVLSRGKTRFLSIAEAIRDVRTLMPACKATDHELEEMLATACVAHGVPVAFDATTANSAELQLQS